MHLVDWAVPLATQDEEGEDLPPLEETVDEGSRMEEVRLLTPHWLQLGALLHDYSMSFTRPGSFACMSLHHSINLRTVSNTHVPMKQGH